MIGIRFTMPTVVWTSVFAVLALWVWSLTDPHVWGRVIASFILLIALSCLLTIRGDTLRQWVMRRWNVRKTLKDSWLVNSKNRAMVWGGESVSMVIETFGDQWELNTVVSDGSSTARQMPLDDLRTQLRQFDILLDHIRVVQYGYKVVVPSERASASLIGTMGTIGHLLGGRTFLVVSLRLRDNLNPVISRQKIGEEVADGLTRTINIATDRVLRVFQSNNIAARVVSSTTALAIHKDIAGGVGEAAKRHKWELTGVPGDANIGCAVSFTPSAASSWNTSTQTQWNEVVAYRQYNCLTLGTDGDRDRVGYSVTYLTEDPGTLHLLPSQGLVRENGRHLARLSNILPLSQDIELHDDGGRMIERTDPDVGMNIPVHPLGVYLGITESTRDRAFMSIERGLTPLWIIGDDEYARRLVLRLSTQRHRIAVTVNGSGWSHLVDTRKSRTLLQTPNPARVMSSCDILVCTPDQLLDLPLTVTSPAVIVVSDEAPALEPHASITRDGDRLLAKVNGKELTLVRETPPTERAWLEAPRRQPARA